MSVVWWVWSRCQWRRRRGGALAATLLFALAVGIVLTAVAGARRTQTAYPRMVEAVDASDILANPDLGTETALDFDAVEALPGVETMGVAAGMFVVPPDADGNPDFSAPILSLASGDGDFGYRLDRPLLSEGHLPDPDAPDQIVIDPALAERLGVSAGDTTELLIPDLSRPPIDGELPDFIPTEFTVTGIGLSTSQILADETFDTNQILLTPAYFEANRRAVGYWGLDLRLVDPSPAGVTAFRNAVDAMVPDEDIEYRRQAVDDDAIRRAVAPQVHALYALGALVGLAALVLVSQGLTRQLVLDEEEARTLQAMGVTRRSLFVGGMLRAALLGLGGAALGAVAAIAASSRFPIGFVRAAEPHPGVDVNLAVLAAGVGAAVALLLLAVAMPVWRGTGLASRQVRLTRPSTVSAALRRRGAGPALVSGVHFALEPTRGRGSRGLRSSLVGAVFAVTLLSAAATFGASLSRLVDTPVLYGWNWSASIGVNERIPALEAALQADPRVDASSPITFNRLVLDGNPIPAVGIDRSPDAVAPTVVEGRAPATDDEIALGGRTLRALDASIGDTVTVRAPDGRTQRLEVVGQAVFPGIGAYSGSERNDLGTGAMATIANLRRFGAPIQKGQELIRLRPGTDVEAFTADYDTLLREGIAFSDEIEIATVPRRPGDIVALARVRRAPAILAGLLATLILVQLALSLLGASRSRRHDLALLKTIGFRRRQVATTVTWQTVTIVVIALVIGIPLGIAAGRTLWTRLGDGLGVVPDPVTPLAALLALAGAALLASAALSYAGGTLLARTRPAAALRSE